MAGRVCVITGASRGLGAVMARAFAAQGDRVAILYRSRQRDGEREVAAITGEGGEARAYRVNVEDSAALEEAVRTITEELGPIEVWVNNAGYARDEYFLMSSPESWREVLATNLDGVANACRVACGPMVAAGRGCLINVSSVSTLRGRPGRAAYTAAKAGVEGLTRSLALELAPRGVRVNCVVPGMFDAGMFKRMPKEQAAQWAEHIPLGRAGEAEELAKVVLFLASEASSYIVGQSIVVDGGLSL